MGATADKIQDGLRLVLRILQFVLGITIVGLYASELKQIKGSDVRYVYAIVVGAVSSLTAVIFCIPAIKAFMFFPWEFIVFILNMGLFGAMGKYFINPTTKTRQMDDKMKHAVWVDCVSMVLWFITFVSGGLIFWRAKRALQKTQHTGRATV